MQFHIARAAATTGNTLQRLVIQKLQEAGIQAPANAHICYGVGYNNGRHPTLNAHCSAHTKLEQARILREGLGLGAIQMFREEDRGAAVEAMGDGHPLLARNTQHSKGRDIKVILEPWQFDAALAGGASFFTLYEPSEREFRTWVYRKRHLGTYEKVLRRPADFKRLGRNHDNGFDFSGLENENVPDALKDIARRAIATLGLDFGAVDILKRPDGSYAVLEVNSAPGVSDDRRRVIQQLSHRIVRWIANGCPARGE